MASQPYYDNHQQDDIDENDLNNEFNNLSVYDKNYQNKRADEEDDDSKGQQVWQKLQKQAANKNSGGGKKRLPQNNSVGSGFGSSNSLNGNGKMNNGQNSVNKKPPLPDRKPEPNYLEKNIEALRNKENLTHRYPEKKYEIVHAKNLGKNPAG